eukprot:Skav210118  [mRNA]  locus=scaffold2194:125629:128798:+ [translate_table: standard]
MGGALGGSRENQDVTTYFGSKAYYEGDLLKVGQTEVVSHELTRCIVYRFFGEQITCQQRETRSGDGNQSDSTCHTSQDPRYQGSEDMETLTVTLESGEKVTVWSYAIDVRDSEDPERELPERGFNEEEDYILFHYTDAQAMDKLDPPALRDAQRPRRGGAVAAGAPGLAGGQGHPWPGASERQQLVAVGTSSGFWRLGSRMGLEGEEREKMKIAFA